MRIYQTTASLERRPRCLRAGRTVSVVLLTIAMAAGPYAAADHDSWTFELTPMYVWGAGLSGDTAAEGTSTPIDTDYRFFSLSNLDLAGSMSFRAVKGHWGGFVDGLYVDFGDSYTVGPVTTSVGVAGGMIEGAFEYAWSDRVQAFGGLRRIGLEADIALTPGPSASRDKNWVDPFLGIRYTQPIGSRWRLRLRGDLGGFGVSSDLVTNLVVSLGYQVNDLVLVRLGYRYLKIDFEESDFVFDANAQGLGVGITLLF